jgi:hypothetical protein
LQIRSAVSKSHFHRRLVWTGLSDVPCAFWLMTASSASTGSFPVPVDDEDEVLKSLSKRKSRPPSLGRPAATGEAKRKAEHPQRSTDGGATVARLRMARAALERFILSQTFGREKLRGFG